MLVFGNIVIRVATLLFAALLPVFAPLDARAVTQPGTAVGRIAASILAIVVVLVLVGWGARRSKLGALVLGTTLLLDGVLAYTFVGENGPLARGTFYLTVPLWVGLGTVGFAIATPHLKSVKMKRAGNGSIVGAVIGVLMLLLAYPRLSNRGAMWTTVLENDPGNEIAASHVAKAQELGNRALAAKTWKTCAQNNPIACACVAGAMDASLVEMHPDEALRIFAASGTSCTDRADVSGLRAEALVLFGDVDAGAKVAAELLAKNPVEPHALYAQALALSNKGDTVGSKLAAKRAVDAGRGPPAQLLLASLLIAQNDLDGADALLKSLVAADPNNAFARYDQGLVADKRERYHDAREAYLAALQLDPKLVDARYNLALLTLRSGFKPEAQHHLEKLIEIAPNDPRIPALSALIAATPDKSN